MAFSFTSIRIQFYQQQAISPCPPPESRGRLAHLLKCTAIVAYTVRFYPRHFRCVKNHPRGGERAAFVKIQRAKLYANFSAAGGNSPKNTCQIHHRPELCPDPQFYSCRYLSKMPTGEQSRSPPTPNLSQTSAPCHEICQLHNLNTT